MKCAFEGIDGGTSRVLSYNHFVIYRQNPLIQSAKRGAFCLSDVLARATALDPKNRENFGEILGDKRRRYFVE